MAVIRGLFLRLGYSLDCIPRFIMHLKQFAMGDKTRGIVVPWLELLLYLYKQVLTICRT